MNRTLIAGFAGVAVAALMVAGGYMAGRIGPGGIEVVAAPPEPDAGRAAIEAVVRDYLLGNPELLVEVQQALQSKRDAEQRLVQLEAIRGKSDAIFDAAHDGIYGNPQGKYTVVEFFDYNCGYCKRAMADMEEMADADPEVRFVLKEFPILGPDSHAAHVVSMAFRALMPEKYGDFHVRLIGGAGRATGDSAMALALEFGADEAAMREAMKDPAIEAAFQSTYELANTLSITGTPSYVVGEEVVFGALGRAVLEEKVANLRECATATC